MEVALNLRKEPIAFREHVLARLHPTMLKIDDHFSSFQSLFFDYL
jgi:hypothetical protein